MAPLFQRINGSFRREWEWAEFDNRLVIDHTLPAAIAVHLSSDKPEWGRG